MLVDLKRKKPRHVRRLQWLAVFVGIAALVLIFDALRPLAGRLYRESQQRRAMAQAKSFLEKKDFNNALLALQVAARANPDNPAAWRAAAEALETAGSNYAVRLREQVLAAEPDSLADQLALAATALRFQDLATAETALARVAAANRNRPEFLKSAAALAFAQKRNDVADAALGQLLALEPGNEQMRFNRAVIRLRHASTRIVSTARADLTAMAQAGQARQVEALRELARDAAVRGDPAEGLRWAAQLTAVPGASFNDALLHLNLLGLQPASTDRDAAERTLAERAATTPTDAAAYATWLLVHNRANDARRWIGSLSPALRTDTGLRAIDAECAAAVRDWAGLGALLKAGAWGPCLPDAIDLAFSARTLEEHRRTELRHNVWRECLSLARADPATLRTLLRLALYWAWEDDAEATLFAIVRNSPHETWAFNALISTAYGRRDTVALHTAYSLLHEAQPSNRRVSGDWSMVTLLLEPGPGETRAKTLAREIYEAEPTNAYFATTHAFALHQQKKHSEALAIMDRLSTSELQVPGRALYYGLLLVHDGQRERARPYLALATKASLLPQEKRLLDDAGALLAADSN